MAKMNTQGITYCIISSGYTGRLIGILGFNNIKLAKKSTNKKKELQNNMYKMDHSKDTTEYKKFVQDCVEELYYDLDSEYLNNFFEKLIYISDTSHGDGTYYLKPDNVTKIQNILKSEGVDSDGTICFKCNDLSEHIQYIHMLRTAHFCDMFGVNTITNMTIIQKDGEKILIVDIDAELGQLIHKDDLPEFLKNNNLKL